MVNKKDKKYIFLILSILVIILVCGCGKKEEVKVRRSFDSLEELNNEDVRIGVVSGYIFDRVVLRSLPKAQVVYFNDRDEIYKALSFGDIDAIADDEPIIRARLRTTDEFEMTDGYLEEDEYSFIFPKTEEGKRLSEEYSSYIEGLKANGQLSYLDEKWFGNSTENKKSKDIAELTGENGVIRFAFDKSNIPFAYMSADKPTGYDIDLLIGFCEEYGYGLEYEVTVFEDMIRDVGAGKYDLGCGAITITEERKENHYFGAPDYVGGVRACVVSKAASEGEGDASFPLKEYLERIFIDSEGAGLILKGLLTTAALVFISLIFGTPFGMIAYIGGKRGSLFVRGFTKFVMWVLSGLPVIVIMMLLYYKYYKPLMFGAFFASAVSLTLSFSAQVYRLIKKYGENADNGNADYDYRVENISGAEFYKKIKDEYGKVVDIDINESIIRLIKMTSVVGIIAVTDLTHAFEMIRIRSFETTLPLIIVASLYFILIKLAEWLIRKIQERRSQVV